MAAVGEVFLLPQIEEADYSAFRAVLVADNQEVGLPPSYTDWLARVAARRRERRQRGAFVRDVPVTILHFSSFCAQRGIERPTVLTRDRYVAELSRH
jgi:hypothetical protein